MTKNPSFSSASSRFSSFGLFALTCAWLAYDHYRPWINFHSEFLAFVGLAALWMGLVRPSQKSLSSSIPVVSVWIAALALLPWLQYAIGVTVFGGDALLSSCYILGLALAVGAGYVGSRIWIHSLWIAAIGSSIIGLAQWLNLEGAIFGMYAVAVEKGDRAMGNLGQANQLASLLLMGIAALAYTLTLERRWVRGWSASLGIVLMTVVLVLTQSRSGMVGALLAAAWLWMRTPNRHHRKAIGLWLGFFIMGVLALPYVSEWLRGTTVRGLQATAPISQRLDLWQQIAYAITQSPWLGYGWNQTPTAQAAGAIAHPHAILGGYAHNFVLDMLAWNGIPLGLLLCGAIGYWFISRLHRCRNVEAVYAMAGLLPFAVHSLLEYPFAYAYFLVAVGLLIGVIEAEIQPSTIVAIPLRWMQGVWALLIPLGVFIGYEYVRIEEDFRVVRYSAMNMADYASADYQPPTIRMLSQLDALLQSRRITVSTTMPEKNVQLLGAAALRFSDEVAWCQYAQALALKGRIPESRHQLDTIRALFGENYYAVCYPKLQRLQLGL